jgi:hypothetical protein
MSTGLDDEKDESDEDAMAVGSIGSNTKGDEMDSSVARLVTPFNPSPRHGSGRCGNCESLQL